MIVVQAGFFRVEEDEVLLERAESAKVAAVVVGCRPLQDAPADVVGGCLPRSVFLHTD